MTTLAPYAPAHKSTLPIAPETIDPRDLVIGLPRVDTPELAYAYGWCLGSEGLDLWTEPFPLDLVDHIREGYWVGLDERVNRALLDSAPPDDLIAEGVAPWAVAPTPDELAAGLRALLARIDDEDAQGELGRLVNRFAREALESIAQDVELFEARTFAELQAREWEMAETAFSAPPCPACSREAR